MAQNASSKRLTREEGILRGNGGQLRSLDASFDEYSPVVSGWSKHTTGRVVKLSLGR